MKLLNRLISAKISEFRNIEWGKKLSSLLPSTKPFWNIYKIIRKKNSSMPHLESSGTLITSYEGKAELLASTFAANHLIVPHYDLEFENMINARVNEFNQKSINFPASEVISTEDIEFIVYNLKNQKSAGVDKIKNEVIKQLPMSGFSFIAFIVNACLKLQYFPCKWKLAKVIPILKSCKPRNIADSYRPISLLSNLSKILEKVILLKTQKVLEEKNIIPPQQFGFRKGHNTSHQIVRICQYVKANFSERKSTGLVLLDLEKAFDSVWHNALIYKLINNELPDYLIKIIQSFLSFRKFKVIINGFSSSLKDVPSGVPQGSCLSPTLFNFYTSDFPRLQSCKFGMYADDIAIYASGENASSICTEIQTALSLIFEYYKHWKIKINAGKSQAIFFTRKRKNCFLPSSNLMLNNCDIPWVNSVKYLGVYLDEKLTFKEHAQKTLHKINLATRLLYPLINRRSLLSNHNKLSIFKVVFQAIILYGSPAWGNCALMHIKKLQIAQNKILKMILRVPWFYSTTTLHQQTRVLTVAKKIEETKQKFLRNCHSSENQLIVRLTT